MVNQNLSCVSSFRLPHRILRATLPRMWAYSLFSTHFTGAETNVVRQVLPVERVGEIQFKFQFGHSLAL